ncbi:unnamed protein product [Boreogadus saida]
MRPDMRFNMRFDMQFCTTVHIDPIQFIIRMRRPRMCADSPKPPKCYFQTNQLPNKPVRTANHHLQGYNIASNGSISLSRLTPMSLSQQFSLEMNLPSLHSVQKK